MTTPIVSLSETRELVDAGRPLVFDCRYNLFAPEEGYEKFLQARIPGARYLHLDRDLSGQIIPGETGRHPLPIPEEFADLMVANGLNTDQPVILYDDKGGGIAARAWWMLRNIGHENVAVLDGGWPVWAVAKLPTETGPEAPLVKIGNFAHPASGKKLCTRDLAQIKRLQTEKGETLIDSRTPERYRGEQEPVDPVAGAIPGASNLPWPDNLRNGKFKDREELKKRFAHLHEEGGQNVFYCGSGVTACHNILAYYYAYGDTPALYPGSWSEYLLEL